MHLDEKYLCTLKSATTKAFRRSNSRYNPHCLIRLPRFTARSPKNNPGIANLTILLFDAQFSFSTMKATSIFLFRNSLFRVVFATLLFIIILSGSLQADSGNATQNGTWGNNSTWLINGVNRTPTCGDTLTIPVGRTVSVVAQHNYVPCIIPLIIVVYGTLEFTNGNKLDLPCGSVVYIMSGGLIRKSTSGGGNSTLISICNIVEWKAGDGDLQGPDVLGNGSLPVELVSFDAQNEGPAVRLTWTTATEQNNDFFTLERSSDGLYFEPFATVNGAGNSSFTIDYNHLDEDPLSGLSYYRLKQTDFDGKFSYSDIVPVFRGERNRFEILNVSAETTDDIRITWLFPYNGYCWMQLYDLTGRKLADEMIRSSSGVNSSKIQAIVPASGLYIVSLSDEMTMESATFRAGH